MNGLEVDAEVGPLVLIDEWIAVLLPLTLVLVLVVDADDEAC